MVKLLFFSFSPVCPGDSLFSCCRYDESFPAFFDIPLGNCILPCAFFIETVSSRVVRIPLSTLARVYVEIFLSLHQF